MSPVSLTTCFDKDTLRLGAALHLRHRHKWFHFSRYLYFFGFFALGICMLIRGDLPFGFTFLTVAPFLFIRKYFWIHRLIGNATSSPFYEKKLRWQIDANGLEQSGPDLHNKMTWDQLHESIVTEKAILLYPQKAVFFTLPRADFQSQADFDRVAQLCRQKTLP